jgi:hypothetical protein
MYNHPAVSEIEWDGNLAPVRGTIYKWQQSSFKVRGIPIGNRTLQGETMSWSIFQIQR